MCCAACLVDTDLLDHGEVLHVRGLAGREPEAGLGDQGEGPVGDVVGLAVGLLLGLVVRIWPPSVVERFAEDPGYRHYEKMYRSLELVEWWMDTSARMVVVKAWVRGLLTVGGLQGAHKAAAGLA